MPSVGELVPSFTLPRAGGGTEPLVPEGRPTVLYFYRGAFCPTCNTYLSRFAAVQERFLAIGEMRAITSDVPGEVEAMAARQSVHFPVLIDAELQVIDAFGLRHRGGGPRGRDITRPSVFVVDPGGRVSFAHIGANQLDRPPIEAVLTELEKAASLRGEGWTPKPLEGPRMVAEIIGGTFARKFAGR